ncbi:MAG: DegV family protein [Thermosipho sp. (in: Bacteria)]|nr:DegV family protein [Thermosipho sp. (in: thermotogales)]
MVKIITDSASDLPKEYIKKYNVEIVPLTVELEGKIYKDGVDITTEKFNQLMIKSNQLPKTAHPSPETFKKVFLKYINDGYDILCLTISSKLSGTYQSAMIAKNNIKTSEKIFVFDTLAASSGEALQVIKASKLIQKGEKIKEVLRKLTEYRNRINILILLDTLENIVKGGRLTKIQGVIAKILNFKIILHNNEGAVEMLEKIRGKKRFFKKVLEIIDERMKKLNLSNLNVGITHVDNIEEAMMFKKIIEEKYNPKDIFVNHMGATIATYAGKGGIIISF